MDILPHVRSPLDGTFKSTIARAARKLRTCVISVYFCLTTHSTEWTLDCTYYVLNVVAMFYVHSDCLLNHDFTV